MYHVTISYGPLKVFVLALSSGLARCLNLSVNFAFFIFIFFVSKAWAVACTYIVAFMNSTLGEIGRTHRCAYGEPRDVN
ncbi:hypothetical protein BDZ91DRAFT_746778 [Kalaharituber pfeilii]|nr:hypothetical protein BDZ91DRAFT_746778 [Kalaharituber pfeilii]